MRAFVAASGGVVLDDPEAIEEGSEAAAVRTDAFAFVRELVTRWDAVAVILVIGLIVFLGEASHGLLEPLAKLQATPLSLDPRNLP